MMIIQVQDDFFRRSNSINLILSECDEQSTKWALCTPPIAQIRLLCAHKIWSSWSNERHWGPRCGVILISTMEEGAEKVRFFREIIEI